MEVMRRYACPLADGSFVLIDVLQVKKNRSALDLSLKFAGYSWGLFGTIWAIVSKISFYDI